MYYKQVVNIDAHFFENTKIKMIRSKPDGESYVCFWVYLITQGAQAVADGEIERPDFKPYSIEDLALISGFKPNIIQEALDIFEELFMITIEKGIIKLKNWEYYQCEELE